MLGFLALQFKLSFLYQYTIACLVLIIHHKRIYWLHGV